jgi:aryl-alcohol dehydrogenase-like predicted oxidoreductase
VRYAAGVGVSLFDTADAYGRGKSEVLGGGWRWKGASSK